MTTKLNQEPAMIIRDAQGHRQQIVNSRIKRLGTIYARKPVYNGPDGRIARPIRPDMQPYLGQPFEVCGLFMTLGASPIPAFVARFPDSALAVMSIGDVFKGWPDLPEAIASARQHGCMDNVVPFNIEVPVAC